MKDAAETRRLRSEAFVFMVLLTAMLVSLFAFVHPWYDATNDGSTYLITARALADGEGYSYLGDTFRLRPPGFSAMLAMFDPTVIAQIANWSQGRRYPVKESSNVSNSRITPTTQLNSRGGL